MTEQVSDSVIVSSGGLFDYSVIEQPTYERRKEQKRKEFSEYKKQREQESETKRLFAGREKFSF